MERSHSIGIHDGTFHADEVTACALLVVFNGADADKIVRTRDQKKLEGCEFVCDVGGEYDPARKLFDHHQASYQGELSSAGMVLKYLRDEKILSPDEFRHFNQSIILGVDAHDNGRSKQEMGVCTFSHVIANFNPVHYDASPEELDAAFFHALEFAIGHLRRFHERYLYHISCRKVVKEAMEGDPLCLFFDRSIPWLENFFALGGENKRALFVVMPAANQWKLRGIPPDYSRRMQVRLPLPEEWAGLLGDELKKTSGIEGAVFCHKGRFTSVWETREDALRALNYILKKNKISDENTL